jgi:transcriptional regulator with XRE-family HTH domain
MARGAHRIQEELLNRVGTPQAVAREALVRLREKANWSQSELARRVSTTPTQIRKLENGDLNISLEWMDRLARAFGVTMSAFLAPHEVAIDADGATHEILTLIRDLPDAERVSLIRAAKGVMDVAQRLSADQSGVALVGSPAMAQEVARTWQEMDERQRSHASEMMRAARQLAPQT